MIQTLLQMTVAVISILVSHLVVLTLACNYDPDATYSDGSCEYSSCAGCMNPSACDYDPDATIPATCFDFNSCVGCMNEEASNYDPDATIDSGNCTIPM